MSTRIITDGLQVHHLTNTPLDKDGKMTDDHMLFYINNIPKLGQVTADVCNGKSADEAITKSYAKLQGRAQTNDLEFVTAFCIDANKYTDNGFRKYIHKKNKDNKCDFSACYPNNTVDGKNNEALLDFDTKRDLNQLIKFLKEFLDLDKDHDTKENIILRFGQEETHTQILKTFEKYKKVLHVGFPSFGKTIISLSTAVERLNIDQTGGLIGVTTPITDTMTSFFNVIEKYALGSNRSVKITCMYAKEFCKLTHRQVKDRIKSGEIIIVLATVQDVRFRDCDDDDDDIFRNKKFDVLKNNITFWIRDEFHLQYGAEKTNKRLKELEEKAKYILDITATAYNVCDQYTEEQIIRRDLTWALDNRENLGLPKIRIEFLETPFLNLASESVASLYTPVEGFDPRKLFARNKEKEFVYSKQLIDLAYKMYGFNMGKDKNPFSIIQDNALCETSRNHGLWVCPAGVNGDSASKYLPAFATNCNNDIRFRDDGIFFIDSYTIDKNRGHLTVSEYVAKLREKYNRVIILTCEKYLTGTDIPMLGHIVLFARINSLALFEQLIGRIIRTYNKKTNAKIYVMCSGLTLVGMIGRIVREQSRGDIDLEERVLNDNISMTEYKIEPREISYDEIQKEASKFFLNASINSSFGSSFGTESYKNNKDIWDKLDTHGYMTKLSQSLTKHNGAKVSTGGSKKTGNKSNCKTNDINKEQEVKDLITNILTETRWISYSENLYDKNVFKLDVYNKMFGHDLMKAFRSSLAVLDSGMRTYFSDLQKACSHLSLEECHDDVFYNTTLKSNIGYVYTPIDCATALVKAVKASSSIKNILVVNALSGSFVSVIKNRFPNAKITCLEHTAYFEKHLKKMGCKVVYNKDDIKMKFDVVIGNPPFQSTTNSKTENQGNLWKAFIEVAYDKLTVNGQLAFVTPKAWSSIGHYDTDRYYLSKFKCMNPSYINVDDNLSERYFKGVGTSISYYVLNKQPVNTTEIVGYNNVSFTVNFNDIKVFPFKNACEESVSILDKVIGANSYDFKEGKDKNVGAKKVYLVAGRFVTTGGIRVDYAGDCKDSYKCSMPLNADELAGAEVFKSKLFHFIFKVLGGEDGLSGTGIMKKLPFVDLNRSWTDEELYNHFKLSDAEIAFIETV